MEDRRVIGIRNLKERVEGIISKFDCVYKYDAFLEDTPMRIIAYIDTNITSYDEAIRFLHFIGDDEEKTNCTIESTGELKPFTEGYKSGEVIHYLIGIEAIKRILALSYDLPEGSYVEDITKIHDEIHVIIKDEHRAPVYS